MKHVRHRTSGKSWIRSSLEGAGKAVWSGLQAAHHFAETHGSKAGDILQNAAPALASVDPRLGVASGMAGAALKGYAQVAHQLGA